MNRWVNWIWDTHVTQEYSVAGKRVDSPGFAKGLTNLRQILWNAENNNALILICRQLISWRSFCAMNKHKLLPKPVFPLEKPCSALCPSSLLFRAKFATARHYCSLCGFPSPSAGVVVQPPPGPFWHLRISCACFGKTSHSAVTMITSVEAWGWGGQAHPGHTWAICCLNFVSEWFRTNCGQNVK